MSRNTVTHTEEPVYSDPYTRIAWLQDKLDAAQTEIEKMRVALALIGQHARAALGGERDG